MGFLAFPVLWFLLLGRVAHSFRAPGCPVIRKAHESSFWKNQNVMPSRPMEKRTVLWANVPSEEEEYKIKLREAEIAIAAAEEARKKLEAKTDVQAAQPPPNDLRREEMGN